MIAIDTDLTTIHITRGDKTTGEFNRLCLKCTYYDAVEEEEVEYKFQPTDKISFVVYEKKGYTKCEILRKDFILEDIGYTEETTCPEIPLDEVDTKKFPLKNKATTYWYVITLNDTATILGHDEDGAKKIIVYPEAEEEE